MCVHIYIYRLVPTAVGFQCRVIDLGRHEPRHIISIQEATKNNLVLYLIFLLFVHYFNDIPNELRDGI